MSRKLIAVFTLLALVALACSLTPTTPTTAKPPSGGNVLFHDDFSNSSSGWDVSSTENGTANYENGGYRIHITTTKLSKWANPSKSFQSDVRIEVDATKVAGLDDNAFGVMCRYQDENNFYKFYLSSDGYAVIIKEDQGSSSVISSPDGQMPKVNGINEGAATNHIRVDCIGDTLTLYANGVQVATATDSSFTGGDVGLVAAAYDTAGTDILFKNFYVYKP